MATLDEIVENSLYTEVKKLRDDISIVMDPTNDKIYLKKVLDVFSVPVFEYLKSHTDVHVPRVKIFWGDWSSVSSRAKPKSITDTMPYMVKCMDTQRHPSRHQHTTLFTVPLSLSLYMKSIRPIRIR